MCVCVCLFVCEVCKCIERINEKEGCGHCVKAVYYGR